MTVGAALMVCMTIPFDPALHPRATGGQFTAKANDAPTGALAADDRTPLDRVRDSLAQQHAEALSAERAAWMAYAFERFAEPGATDVTLTVEQQEYDAGDTFPALYGPDGYIEGEDSLHDVLPESFGEGHIQLSFEGGVYTSWIEDEDGQSIRDVLEPGRKLSVDEARELARAATEHRAAVRDAEEQAAIVDAFERYADLASVDEAVFTPGDVDGMRVLHVEGIGFSIAAGDDVQAKAFSFLGEEVLSLKVTRTGDGRHTIARALMTPVTREEQVRVTEFNGTPNRWVHSDL